MTHMLPHTQFTSRDRVPGLEGCYLICGTFLIGNLIPGPRNLVFADRFFHTGVIGGFLFLLGFPLYKITTKSKWRLQRKTVLLEDGFSNFENQPTFFLSFKSESSRPVDLVGSTVTMGDITPLVKAGPVVQHVLFSVVKDLGPYNAIVGQAWLHAMKVVPSTYHQMISYLTNAGQIDLLSSQLAARQCYQLSI